MLGQKTKLTGALGSNIAHLGNHKKRFPTSEKMTSFTSFDNPNSIFVTFRIEEGKLSQ